MVPQGEYMMAPQHPGYYPGYQMNHMGQMPPQPPIPSGGGQGFMLHGQPQSLPHHGMYQNGQGYYSPEHQYRGYPSTAQNYPPSKLVLHLVAKSLGDIVDISLFHDLIEKCIHQVFVM